MKHAMQKGILGLLTVYCLSPNVVNLKNNLYVSVL
jgi:branched-subunit amino acid transport protein AzlD